ncbi:MAG: transketolase [Clostridiales Family XIII bacterium]|nr:transketolase [Clostridia bacterium]MDY3010113.1 transketolase [Clostridiales Family XIII bacterium]
MNAEELKEKCRYIRRLIIEEIGTLGVGHVGGSLSAVEALVALYYVHMNIDPDDPKKEKRDRFVLSKGHAGPALYAVLADKGYFPIDFLKTLNQPGTYLPSHCDMNLTTGIDMTAGSLGQGLSCAAGMAYGSKLKDDGAYIYCMIGDGESQEGQIWEAAMFAAHTQLARLIAFTDYNKLELDGYLKDQNDIEPLKEKWAAFGWNALEVDGSDISSVVNAVFAAKESRKKPTMIILHTVKGKGVSFIEADPLNNHHMTLGHDEMNRALEELDRIKEED